MAIKAINPRNKQVQIQFNKRLMSVRDLEVCADAMQDILENVATIIDRHGDNWDAVTPAQWEDFFWGVFNRTSHIQHHQ